MSAVVFPCPRCGACLTHTGEAVISGFVLGDHDPERKPRLEISIDCEECGATFSAFLAYDHLCDAKGNPCRQPTPPSGLPGALAAMWFAALVTLGLVWSSTPSAAETSIYIETPCSTHDFAECEVHEAHIDRHATVSTFLADCGAEHVELRRDQPWQPSPHPDDGPLRFETRLAMAKPGRAWLQCALVGYTLTPWGGDIHLQCLDTTEYPGAGGVCHMRTRRAKQ